MEQSFIVQAHILQFYHLQDEMGGGVQAGEQKIGEKEKYVNNSITSKE